MSPRNFSFGPISLTRNLSCLPNSSSRRGVFRLTQERAFGGQQRWPGQRSLLFGSALSSARRRSICCRLHSRSKPAQIPVQFSRHPRSALPAGAERHKILIGARVEVSDRAERESVARLRVRSAHAARRRHKAALAINVAMNQARGDASCRDPS